MRGAETRADNWHVTSIVRSARTSEGEGRMLSDVGEVTQGFDVQLVLHMRGGITVHSNLGVTVITGIRFP